VCCVGGIHVCTRIVGFRLPPELFSSFDRARAKAVRHHRRSGKAERGRLTMSIEPVGRLERRPYERPVIYRGPALAAVTADTAVSVEL